MVISCACRARAQLPLLCTPQEGLCRGCKHHRQPTPATWCMCPHREWKRRGPRLFSKHHPSASGQQCKRRGSAKCSCLASSPGDLGEIKEGSQWVNDVCAHNRSQHSPLQCPLCISKQTRISCSLQRKGSPKAPHHGLHLWPIPLLPLAPFPLFWSVGAARDGIVSLRGTWTNQGHLDFLW